MAIDIQLEIFVASIKHWINQNYPVRQSIADVDMVYYPDDHWQEIYTYVGSIFDSGLQNRPLQDLKNVLYLIARNYRVARLLSWHEPSTISKVGNLTKSDFILLAQTVQNLNHEDFHDAYRQIIVLLQEYPSNEFLEFIPSFMDKAFQTSSNNYIKNKALKHFIEISHPNCPKMIQESWKAADEWLKDAILTDMIFIRDPSIVEYCIESAQSTNLKAYEIHKKAKLENLREHLSSLKMTQVITTKKYEVKGFTTETLEEFSKRYFGFGKELFQKIEKEMPDVYQYMTLAYNPSDELCYASAFYDDGYRKFEIMLDNEVEQIVFMPEFAQWHAQYGDWSESDNAINSVIALLKCQLHILNKNE